MRALAARILTLSLIAGPAHASPGWTFSSPRRAGAGMSGSPTYSPPFAIANGSRRILKAYLKGRGVSGAVARCPAPKDDKVEVVNAQFTASEFHHKLGDTLHEVFAPEFDPRR